MSVSSLRLRNFRNYSSFDVAFSPGLNLIVGPNGSGKTNVAEAVALLLSGRSFRTSEEKPLVKIGETDGYAEALLEGEGLSKTVACHIGKEGKRFSLDEKPLRKLSDLSSLGGVACFSPRDVSIFSGPPGDRRSYLDQAISQGDEGYLKALSLYNRLLKERNALLKDPYADPLEMETLTERLVEAALPVEKGRLAYVGELEKAVSEICARLYGEKRRVELRYQPFLKLEGFIPQSLAYYEGSLEGDKFRGTTQGGIHREDFRLFLDEADIAGYGSQGERRLASIALKLAPCLIKGEGKKPLPILDDVLSELDDVHKERLYEVLEGLGQCLLTATDADRVGALTINIGSGQKEER